MSKQRALIDQLAAWQIQLEESNAVVNDDTVIQLRWGDLKLNIGAVIGAMSKRDTANARAEAAERVVEAARAYWETEPAHAEGAFEDMIAAIDAYDTTKDDNE